jgi:hypothetical protein
MNPLLLLFSVFLHFVRLFALNGTRTLEDEIDDQISSIQNIGGGGAATATFLNRIYGRLGPTQVLTNRQASSASASAGSSGNASSSNGNGSRRARRQEKKKKTAPNPSGSVNQAVKSKTKKKKKKTEPFVNSPLASINEDDEKVAEEIQSKRCCCRNNFLEKDCSDMCKAASQGSKVALERRSENDPNRLGSFSVGDKLYCCESKARCDDPGWQHTKGCRAVVSTGENYYTVEEFDALLTSVAAETDNSKLIGILKNIKWCPISSTPLGLPGLLALLSPGAIKILDDENEDKASIFVTKRGDRYSFSKYPRIPADMHKHKPPAVNPSKFVLALLVSLVATSSAEVVKTIELVKTPFPGVMTLDDAIMMQAWRIDHTLHEELLRTQSHYVETGQVYAMSVMWDTNITVTYPCSYTGEVDKDECSARQQRPQVRFRHNCPVTVDKCSEALANMRDPSVHCTMVTDLNEYEICRRTMQNVLLLHSFTISHKPNLMNFFSISGDTDTKDWKSYMSIGKLQVNGEHVATFFCSGDHLWSAFHAIDSLWTRVTGSEPLVEACGKRCSVIGNITRVGRDVLRATAPDWCSNLASNRHSAILVAISPKGNLVTMDAVLETSEDGTTVNVGSGSWVNGMSGGSLVIGGLPVGIVTAVRGFAMLGQTVLVYGFDGMPFQYDGDHIEL